MTPPLVLVTWVDSRQTEGSWQFLSDLSPPAPVICRSVGWLVHDGPDCLIVAQSLGDVADDDIQTAGRKHIPRPCVQETKVLMLADPLPPVEVLRNVELHAA